MPEIIIVLFVKNEQTHACFENPIIFFFCHPKIKSETIDRFEDLVEDIEEWNETRNKYNFHS